MSPQFTAVYNKKGTHFRYIVAVAFPVFFFSLSIYGLVQHGWTMFFAGFPFAVVSVPFVWAMLADKKRKEKSRIEVYPSAEEVHFAHFRFVSQFLPESPRELEVLEYSDFIDGRTWVSNGIRSLHLRTTKGSLVIPEEMTHFDELVQLFGSIIEFNKENEDEYESSLQNEPKVETAWYGWVILVSAIAIVIYIGWKFLYV